MRIIECYIKSFGSLKDKRLEFDRGLSSIVGENGAGKSTVLGFIKAMLYGLGESRKTSIEENDRKHYLPWGGGFAGGTLTFTAGTKQYRVERSFGRRPAEDTFALYDTHLGRLSSDFGSNLGEELFGIDAEGFERTAYFSERNLIPKADISSSDVGGEGAISELSAGALAEASEILEEQRRFYFKKGGGGAIADLKNEIRGVERELEGLSAIKARAREAEARINELSASRAGAEAEQRKISERRGRLQAKETMRRADERKSTIRGELSALSRQKDALIEFFGGAIPDGALISELEYKSRRAVELKAKEAEFCARDDELSELSSFLGGRISEEDAELAKKALEALDSPPDARTERCEQLFSKRIPTHKEAEEAIAAQSASAKPFGLIISIFGIIATSIGAVLGLLQNQLLFAICAIGALLLTVGIIVTVATAARSKAAKAKALSEFISSIGEFDTPPAHPLSALIEIKGLIDDAKSRQNKISASRQILCELCRRFGYSSENYIDAARIILTKYDRLKALRTSSAGEADKNPAIEGVGLLLEVAEALSAYKIESDDPISELKSKLEDYRTTTQRIISLSGELERLNTMSALDGDAEGFADTQEAIEQAARTASAYLSAIDGELAILNREYDADMRALESRVGLEIQLSILEERLSRYESELRAIQGAGEYLKLAAESINEKYLSGALASFKSYSRSLGLTECSAEMKTDFSTSVVDGTGTHATEAVSRGLRDGYRLAARLAILDTLFTREMPPLLLDDPFLSFDDARISDAIALLERAAEDRQVIYLTCSKSRAPRGYASLD